MTDATSPGRITKPTLFISHAVTDEPIASIIESEVDHVFAGGVTVFASSILGTVKPGADWLRSEMEELFADLCQVPRLVVPRRGFRPRVGVHSSEVTCMPESGVGGARARRR